MRDKLRVAREKKNWTLVKAATELGVVANTLSRWENGRTEIHPFHRQRLCEVYGMSAWELGIDSGNLDEYANGDFHQAPTNANSERPINEQTQRLCSDLTIHLFALIVKVHHVSCKELQRLQAYVTITLEKSDSMNNTKQNYHMNRREALSRVAALALVSCNLTSVGANTKAPIEEILIQCSAGIAACRHLSTGTYDELSLVYATISDYLPTLKAIVKDSSLYRKEAALLVAQCLQLKGPLAYYFEDLRQETSYMEGAVMYAQQTDNPTFYAIALRELAAAYYEDHRYVDALNTGLKAQKIINDAEPPTTRAKNATGVTPVPPFVQSYINAGLARFQAIQRNPEAHFTMGKAYEMFKWRNDEDTSDAYRHNEANVYRQDAMTHYYLGDYKGAMDTFGQIIDIDHSDIPAKLQISYRAHSGIVNEALFTSLKLPKQQRDKMRSIHLFVAGVQKSLAIKSKERFKEILRAYDIMESLWEGEEDVQALRDLLTEKRKIVGV